MHTGSVKLQKLYYNPKLGYTGIDDLTRKSGLSSEFVKNWLAKQKVYTLHKPIRHRFKTRRVLVSQIDDQWQADLVDMQKYKTQNKNFNYILTVIDIFSKYAWGLAIKRKTGEEILKAFKFIFKKRVPRKIQTDKGLEFINKLTQDLFKKHNIQWFATENETKAQVVERFNRTLKSRMWKYFTHNDTKKWLEVLPELMKNYNNSYHRSIKMTPIQASKSENAAEVYRNLFPTTSVKKSKNKFKIGDRVRISKKFKDFRKGYLPNFTSELFVIKEIKNTDPVTYIINDLNNEKIVGSFYEQEMVKYDNEVFEIEKVLKTSKNKLLVKWKGYDSSSWIDKKDLTNIP